MAIGIPWYDTKSLEPAGQCNHTDLTPIWQCQAINKDTKGHKERLKKKESITSARNLIKLISTN